MRTCMQQARVFLYVYMYTDTYVYLCLYVCLHECMYACNGCNTMYCNVVSCHVLYRDEMQSDACKVL